MQKKSGSLAVMRINNAGESGLRRGVIVGRNWQAVNSGRTMSGAIFHRLQLWHKNDPATQEVEQE